MLESSLARVVAGTSRRWHESSLATSLRRQVVNLASVKLLDVKGSSLEIISPKNFLPSGALLERLAESAAVRPVQQGMALNKEWRSQKAAL